MKRLFLFVCLVLFGIHFMTASVRADDTFLNYLFPSIFGAPDKGPKPQDTLIAPFAQNANKTRVLSAAERQAMVSPENSTPLNEPHRSSKYIADWASEKVADVFIFDTETIDKHLGALSTNFTETGVKNATDYLDKSKMINNVRQERRQIRAFVKNTAQIMNEGDFNGTYRWLIDVPITVSTMPLEMKNYLAAGKKMTPITQDLVIRVQVSRMKSGYINGMAIESFTVMGASS